jgi:hypothetical protein
LTSIKDANRDLVVEIMSRAFRGWWRGIVLQTTLGHPFGGPIFYPQERLKGHQQVPQHLLTNIVCCVRACGCVLGQKTAIKNSRINYCCSGSSVRPAAQLLSKGEANLTKIPGCYVDGIDLHQRLVAKGGMSALH